MRKYASHVWLGLAFLVLVSRGLPGAVEMFGPAWPSSGLGALACWGAILLLGCARGLFKNWVRWRFGVTAFDACLFSVAAAAGCQLMPAMVSLGLLELAAYAFGDVLLGVTVWPLLIVSFAYIIAPGSSLVQADHPVQYRDRENASKVLLGAAGVALLYGVLTNLV